MSEGEGERERTTRNQTEEKERSDGASVLYLRCKQTAYEEEAEERQRLQCTRVPESVSGCERREKGKKDEEERTREAHERRR